MIEVKGSVELAPISGLADAIVDLVDTGRTLRENGLEVREEIAPSTARLIANRVAHKLRAAEIDDLSGRLRGERRAMRVARVGLGRGATPPRSWTASVPPRRHRQGSRSGSARSSPRFASAGDTALNELIVHLDGVVERPESHRIPGERLAGAREHVHPELIAALELAASNIRAVADAELDEPPVEVDLPQGQRVEIVERPVAAAGVYAPGGRASYPSSVLMGCVPARVAGVERLALATPPEPDGSVGAVTLAAAAIGGRR